MKTRNGFVSNSSSSSFIIKNKTEKTLTLVDFVKENPQLVTEFLDMYDWNKDDPSLTQENVIKNAIELNETFLPKEEKVLIFGDESYTTIGRIYDYALRDGGESNSFEWYFHESLR